jgi:hypothetical protein
MRDFHSSIIYSYASPAYAAVLCKYSATRMLINSTRLQILALLDSSLNDSIDEQRSQCLSHMKTMGNDLASSVPFYLERFKVITNPDSPGKTSFTLNIHEDVKLYMATLVL